ncbi:TonB-dependent receptor [Polymorphobacter glacialis]|uniref:TonB-dependent receptor n=1 Tax=Sandarakinorhabdus glacialis TaxID=1614636 RepID=A0A916ZKN8_9SPHN|nr:TonB-dependent receptor [Polymorphobacter glacialis]GGE01794.1 TonB-dependent receptor [Polymorphobacter glacialis]
MSSRFIKSSFLLAGVSVAAILAAPANAQAVAATAAAVDDDTIVVTATKRASDLQDVPFSINAQTQADIQRSGASTIEDLSRNVAGLTIQNLGPGQSQVSIRGVSAGQIVRDQPGVKEQVGFYLDETVISLSLFTPDIDLFDLNRVETLRGPQGTLFGSGSVGGTIRYITNKPTTERVEGTVEADLNIIDGGSVGGSAKAAVNLPLSESIAVRAVGYYTRYGGFIDALREGGGTQENVNKGERYGGRVALLLQPSENVKITPRVLYQEISTEGFNRQDSFNLFANPFTTTRAPVTFGERQQYLLQGEEFRDKTLIIDGTVEVDLDGVNVTSVTSYTDRDILVSRDAGTLSGSVSIDLGFPDAAVTLPSNLRDTTKVQSFTQELRLGSANDSPFQWVVGAFYANTDRDYQQRLPTPGYDAFTDATLGAGTSAAVANGFPADSPFNSSLPYALEQLSGFGEVSYRFFDRLTLTGGLRWYDFQESRTITSGGLFANGDTGKVDRTQSDDFNPRFLASFAVTDDVTINAQAAKGFRLGGVNDPLNGNLCTAQDRAIFGGFQAYGDETLWNYEGGIKAKAGGITFNAAVFYSDIRNLQTTLDAGSCSSRIVFNVPKAHSFGVEFELTGRPVEGLIVGVSGSVLQAEFDSTVRDGNGNVIGGIRDGNRLPTVPKFQISANANYSFPISDTSNVVLNASYQHVGDRYTQPGDQEPPASFFVSGLPFGGATGNEVRSITLLLPAYDLVNISAGLEFGGGYSLTAYVNNLFDENALLSLDRERGGRARIGYATNQPRTFGVTARRTF